MKKIIIIILSILCFKSIKSNDWEQNLAFPNNSNCNVYSIQFLNANIGWAGISDADHYGAIYKTTDKGVSWFKIYELTAGDQTNNISVNFVDENTGFLYIGKQIFKTVNGGTAWTQKYTMPQRSARCCIRFVDYNTGYAAFSKTSGKGVSVYKSGDGGTSWNVTSINNYNTEGGQDGYAWLGDINYCYTDHSKLYVVGQDLRFSPPSIIIYGTIDGFNSNSIVLRYVSSYDQRYDFLTFLPNDPNTIRIVGDRSVDNVSNSNLYNSWDVTYSNSPYNPAGGISFATNNYGFAALPNGMYSTGDGGVTWNVEFSSLSVSNSGMSSFGDVAYQGGTYGNIFTRKINSTYRTYYDLSEQPTSNAFSVDGQMKNTTSTGEERGGFMNLVINQYTNYNGMDYVFYKWNDNSTNYNNGEYNEHYYVWNGDISANFKGKFISTTPSALNSSFETKSIKDTIINGVNTIHTIHESMGGIFYTKSNDDGNTFQNEEVVNFDPDFLDADNNRNSSLTIINSSNYHTATAYDANQNVAAVWERYNSSNGKIEVKAASRQTYMGTTRWVRYGHWNPNNPDVFSFTATSDFQAKPKIFMYSPSGFIGGGQDANYTAHISYLKQNGNQTELRVYSKHNNSYQDNLIDNGNITNYAVCTLPFSIGDEFFLYIAYIKGNQLFYRLVSAGYSGGLYFNNSNSISLSSASDFLNKGDLDITVRNSSDNPISGNLVFQPVIVYKGELNTRTEIPGPYGPITSNITYYPIIYKEQLSNGSWQSGNFQIQSSNVQKDCNIEGSKLRNSYEINYKSGTNTMIQYLPKWNSSTNSGYHFDPGSYPDVDAKLTRGSLVTDDDNSKHQKILSLQNSWQYQVASQSSVITNQSPPPGSTDEVSAVFVDFSNIQYSINLGSIIINSQQVDFSVNPDSVINNVDQINSSLRSNLFYLHNNDTLIVGRDAFYLSQDPNNPFQSIIYSVKLMYKSSQEHSTLSTDTLQVADSISVEYLEGYIISNIKGGADSMYVQLHIDTVYNIISGGLNSISGGFSGLTGDNGNSVHRLMDRVFFKKPLAVHQNLIPTSFSLHQNFPNPFNPVTTIKYDLPKDSKVTIKVYDLLGKEVATLVNENKQAGYYETVFNGNNLASGVYFYRINAGEFNLVKKMVLVK